MKKRFLALLTICAILAMTGCASAQPAQPAASASEPKLVKTVTEYAVDYETKDWTAVRVFEYTYENGYPVEIKTTELEWDGIIANTYEYTFEEGVPVSRTEYNSDGVQTQVMEYNEGRPYHAVSASADGISKGDIYYAYANGDEYMTLLLSANHGYQEGQLSDTMEEVDSVEVTTENGLLKKTVNSGMYANWGVQDEKEWMRFNGTYTANYDENGIVTDTSGIFRAGPSGPQYKIEKTMENGLVTELVKQVPDNDPDTWMNESKYTFEYTDTAISQSRYAQMINYFALGEFNQYYAYNWY